MRQLRVVGLSDDGETVIVEDPIRHERFSVPGDERLRAAARGDVRRLGQMEIEHTSPLRPRDIQARIRAGESVEQVAAGGGVSAGHVERFAYPVLLERARVAEMAGRAHPVRGTDPEQQDPRTLGEIVSTTFAARGQDYDEARWDAWKGDDAQWTVALSWQAGRSDNIASWTYRPGPAGGVVVARDDHARDLVGETPTGGPRRMDGTPDEPAAPEAGQGTPSEDAFEAEEYDEAPAALAASGDTAPARPDRRRGGAGTGTGSGRGSARTSRSGEARSRSTRPVPDQRDHRRGDAGPGSPRRATGTAGPATGHPPAPPETPDPASSAASAPSSDEPATEAPAKPAAEPRPAEPRPAEGGRSGKARRNHPIVPSWEDVLLGTRSPRT